MNQSDESFGIVIFSSTMTRIPITELFNAYDLQVNPLEEDKIRSQEVVNYCEARFRVALQAMIGRSDKDQKWMYKILYQEMVFVINYTHLHDYHTVLGVMFLSHRCGSGNRPTSQHFSHCQVTWPGYVPSRHDAEQSLPTWP